MTSPSEQIQPSWGSVWLRVAGVMASRSRCDRDQVGAALVSSDNRVLSSGYNGAPATYAGDTGERCHVWCERARLVPTGEAGSPGYQDCPAQHAEVNCLLRAPAVDHGVETTLYVSTVPCFNCAKMIGVCHSTKRLTHVVAAMGGVGDSYRDVDGAVRFMQWCGVKVHLVSLT